PVGGWKLPAATRRADVIDVRGSASDARPSHEGAARTALSALASVARTTGAARPNAIRAAHINATPAARHLTRAVSILMVAPPRADGRTRARCSCTIWSDRGTC